MDVDLSTSATGSTVGSGDQLSKVCGFGLGWAMAIASKSRDGHLRFRREWGLVASLEAPRGASMVAERGWERVRVAKRPDSNGEPIWHDSWHDSSSKGSSWALSEQWF